MNDLEIKNVYKFHVQSFVFTNIFWATTNFCLNLNERLNPSKTFLYNQYKLWYLRGVVFVILFPKDATTTNEKQNLLDSEV